MTTSSASQPPDQSQSDDPLSSADLDLSFPWRPAPDCSLDDVGGMKTLKQELRRTVVRPLGPKREQYERFGIDVPNLLFEGPPGTGKTYSATALAGELNYPFVFLTSGRLQSKWVNESTDQVQQLFREAARISTEHGYAVIIADELDTLLPARGGGDKHQEDQKVVTEFLAYLERCAENNTLFIGTTNRRDDLDPAAVRSGRIDREFRFTLPDKQTRAAILNHQLAGRPMRVSAQEILQVAEETEGFSAAALTTIVDEAARYAIEDEAKHIVLSHLRQAITAYSVGEN